jgi:histidine triad (HIT) family protein
VYSHEPPGYVCPFCNLDAAGQLPGNVYRGERASAFISNRWWPNNRGHVLIVPNAHHENLYDLPAEDGYAVFDLTQKLARAMREVYGCDGVSTRQHNEPAGDQHVWHFHQHLFPRYRGDRLYESAPIEGSAPAEELARYAEILRAALAAV